MLPDRPRPLESYRSPSVIWFDDEREAFDSAAHHLVGRSANVELALCHDIDELFDRARGPGPMLLCCLSPQVPNLTRLQDLSERLRPSCVISDLQISGDALAGVKILSAVAAASRQLPEQERPELVLYSAGLDDISRTLATGLGVNRIISKRDTAELLELLANWFHTAPHAPSDEFQHLHHQLESARHTNLRMSSELTSLQRRNQKLARDKNALKKQLEAANANRPGSMSPSANSKGRTEQKQRSEQLDHVTQMVFAHNHDLSNTASLTLKTLEHLCADEKLVPPILLADLQRARIAAKHCDVLVQSLSSIAGNEKQAGTKPSILRAAVTDVCEILRRKIPNAISVRAEIPERLPLCAIPTHLVVRMLLNLLLNSLEAMPKGGTILIKATSPRGQKKHLRLEVRDSGCGIRKSDISKVCRHDFSTKGKRLGFGLFIVQRIVSDHKGKITLRSERGKGTTITLELPSI